MSSIIDSFTGVKAAKAGANAQLEAARIAAKAAEFKPWAVTTGFGSSQFGDGTASYTVDPRIAAARDFFYGQAQSALPTAEQERFAGDVSGYGRGLFQTAMGAPVQQQASDYYNRMQNIMAPARAQEESRLADTLFKTGRLGAGVGMGSGYVNPQQYALLQAREQENQKMAMQAEDLMRERQIQDLSRGLEAYGAGQSLRFAPAEQYKNLFGLGTTMEQLGMSPLDIGAQLGGRQAQSGAVQAQALLAGGMGAAPYKMASQMGPTNIVSGLWGTVQPGVSDWAKSKLGGLWGSSSNVAPGINLMGSSPWTAGGGMFSNPGYSLPNTVSWLNDNWMIPSL